MFNLTLPLNFGERPCDRDLVDILGDHKVESDQVLAWALKVWKDFGIARDDRREVPVSPADRRQSRQVRTIERYIGWTKEPGAFVEAAIEAKFFKLVTLDETKAELILADFYPANRTGATDITASALGGAGKRVGNVHREAMAGADEQLEMFKQGNHDLLKKRSEAEVKAALFFIHQVCGCLRRATPQTKEWKEELLTLALDVKASFDSDKIEKTLRWFVIRRDDQELGARLDFILKDFARFVARAQREIADAK